MPGRSSTPGDPEDRVGLTRGFGQRKFTCPVEQVELKQLLAGKAGLRSQAF